MEALKPDARHARSAWLVCPMILVLFFVGMFGLGFMVRSCQGRRPAPDAPPTDDLGIQAKALGNDPARIEQWVNQSITREGYVGSMRGPLGTLWAGSGSDQDRAALRDALLEKAGGPAAVRDVALDHRLTIRLEGVSRDGTDARFEHAVPTSQVTDGEFGLRWRADKGGREPVLVILGREVPSGLDAQTLKSLALVFSTRSPNRVVEKRCEVFNREFKGAPVRVDPWNSWTIVITTGWVPRSACDRSRRADGRLSDSAAHESIAYRFLSQSDEVSRRVAGQHKVPVTVDTPRVTIVRSDQDSPSGPEIVSMELCGNSVLALTDDARARAAFHTFHSLYDECLAGEVLRESAPLSRTSAAVLAADAAVGAPVTPALRLALLTRLFQRILQPETRPGTTILLRAAGFDAPRLRVTRTLAGIECSDYRGLFPGNVLPAPLGKHLDPGAMASETERAFLADGGQGTGYELAVEFSEGAGARWFERARVFSYGGAESSLNFERQLTTLSPDLTFETVDYWDDVQSKNYEAPIRTVFKTTAADLAGADVFSLWIHNDAKFQEGRTWDGISRRAFRELKTRGWTDLKFRYANGTDSPVIRFWASAPWTMEQTLNNRPFKVAVISMSGVLLKATTTATSPAKFPKLMDDQNLFDLSQWTMLDDPDFPLFVRTGDIIQTSIPGRVVDADTGIGLDNVTVSLPECGVETLSWPDGRFSLPLIPRTYRVFEVTAKGPEFESLGEKRDFRKADAFPIELSMVPARRRTPFLSFGTPTAARDFESLGIPPHSALRMHTASTHDGAFLLVAGVDAWLELSPATGEFVARKGHAGAVTLRTTGLKGDLHRRTLVAASRLEFALRASVDPGAQSLAGVRDGLDWLREECRRR